MGVSSTVNIFVGYKIDADSLFDYEEFDIFSCQHFKENPTLGINNKFCPECGTKINHRTGSNREMKPEFDGVILSDMDSMHNGAWNTQIGKHKVELRELVNNYKKEDNIFVGVWLNRFNPRSDDSSVKKIESMATLPREDVLKNTLEMYGVPFNPDSFGIYLLTDWY